MHDRIKRADQDAPKSRYSRRRDAWTPWTWRLPLRGREWAAIVALGLIAMILSLWLLPGVFVDESQINRKIDSVASVYNAARIPIGVVMAALLAGIAATLGVLTTRESIQVTRESLALTEANVSITRDGLGDARKRDQLDRLQWQEEQRHKRFKDAAEQLGSSSPAVRLAGVFAMATLATDWVTERQMCVDVLCGYARLPWPTSDSKGESEIRETVMRALGHLTRLEGDTPLNLDLRGASIVKGNLGDIPSANVQLEDASVGALSMVLRSGRLVLIGTNFVDSGRGADDGSWLTFTNECMATGVVVSGGTHRMRVVMADRGPVDLGPVGRASFHLHGLRVRHGARLDLSYSVAVDTAPISHARDLRADHNDLQVAGELFVSTWFNVLKPVLFTAWLRGQVDEDGRLAITQGIPLDIRTSSRAALLAGGTLERRGGSYTPELHHFDWTTDIREIHELRLNAPTYLAKLDRGDDS